MLIALSLLLLLLEQFVEADLLLGIEDRAKLFPGLLQFFANFGRHRFHDFFRALLAGGNDFVDLLALISREGQVAFNPAQKFDSKTACGDRLNGTIALGVLGTRRGLGGRIFDKQPAGHHARAENDDSRENDFPGVHQMESEAC